MGLPASYAGGTGLAVFLVVAAGSVVVSSALHCSPIVLGPARPGTRPRPARTWRTAANDPVWGNLAPYDYTYRAMAENGPDSSVYSGQTTERNKYKAWFKDKKAVFTDARVVQAWANANPEPAWEFIKAFTSAYNRVAQRTSADYVPMAKGPSSD